MKSMKFILIAVVLLMGAQASADEIWQGFPNGNYIKDIAFQGDYVWCATEGSLVRWDKRDGTYRQFTTENGLLNNRVTSVFVDRDNMLWVGTLSGPQRYDGSNFTNYSLENSELDYPYVSCIDQAPDGAMWFGVRGGLARLEDEVWTFYTRDNGCLDVDYVNIFAVDKEGVVWFSHVKSNHFDGLMSFDSETCTHYTTINSDLISFQVSEIAVDENNVKWLATPSGLQSFDGETWTLHDWPDNKYDRIRSLDINADGAIWVATFPGSGGAQSMVYPDEPITIARFDNEVWTEIPVRDLLPIQIMGIERIRVDADGTPWFVTRNNGMDSRTLYSYGGNELSSYLVEGPLSYFFNDIFIDEKNDKWFATSNGLARFDGVSWERFQFDLAPEEYRYETYQGERHYNPSYLTGTNDIQSIAHDKDGVIWIASRFGVRSYDGASWKLYSEVNVEEIQNISSEFYFAGVTKNNVKYFLGKNFLVMYDGENWTYDSWLKDNDLRTPSWIGGNKVIMMDNNDTLWFIDSNGSVVSYDGIEWKLHTSETTGIEGVGTSCVVDNNNVKWFGTNKNLYSYDDIEWKNHSAELVSLKGITFMIVDESNIIWMLNGNKLQSYDGVSQMEYAVNLSGFSMQLAIDNNGLIWIAGINNIGPGGIVSINKDAVLSSVDDEQVLPTAVSITANYPNPFNPSTTINFTLDRSGYTSVVIYNIMGQSVRELVTGQMNAGIHNVDWDGRDDSGNAVSSGVYICRLKMGEQVATKRLMLMK